MTARQSSALPLSSSVPAAWNVLCPNCGGCVGAPDNGSHLWIRENFDTHKGQPMKCEHCEFSFRLQAPRNIRVI